MRQVEGISQQKGYRVSTDNGGYKAHRLKRNYDRIDRTQLTNEEHCWTQHYCLYSHYYYSVSFQLNIVQCCTVSQNHMVQINQIE